MKTILLTLFLSTSALADSYYPTAVPSRIYGSDQHRAGSCMGDSFVTALEHKMAANGLDFKISLHHIHNFNFKDSDHKKPSLNLNMTPTSIQIVNSYGGIVPDYLLPEDTEGADLLYLKDERPPIETMGIYTNSLPAQSYGYSRTYYSFKKGYSNTRKFSDLMNAVKSGQVVALSIDATILYSFDGLTGLLTEPYAPKEEYFANINHSVAVVGYDDELQGFIIRNSWNDKNSVYNTNQRDIGESEKELLKKFRFKISKKNLPGYYLFPYQFVRDLEARNTGGFDLLTLDMNNFSNVYALNFDKYEIINAFYSCDKVRTIRNLKSLGLRFKQIEQFAKGTEEYKNAMKIISESIYRQINLQRNILPFAKLSRLTDGSIDRVKEFYQGKFAAYYCGKNTTADSFWPTESQASFVNDPKFNEFISGLSKDRTNISAWFELFKYLAHEVEAL